MKRVNIYPLPWPGDGREESWELPWNESFQPKLISVNVVGRVPNYGQQRVGRDMRLLRHVIGSDRRGLQGMQ